MLISSTASPSTVTAVMSPSHRSSTLIVSCHRTFIAISMFSRLCCPGIGHALLPEPLGGANTRLRPGDRQLPGAIGDGDHATQGARGREARRVGDMGAGCRVADA